MKNKSFLILGLSAFLIWNCSKSESSSSSEEENEEVTTVVDKTLNQQETGASANDFLSNDNYDKLIIEVAYVTGYQPEEAAILDNLEFIEEITFKEDIEVQYLELDSPNEATLSTQEVYDLEQENRTVYTDGTTLGMYIYFSDTTFEDDDPDSGLYTLGAVYLNTSMVIYQESVREIAKASTLISNATVETATLNHEFGHLFGLVNIGSDMVHDHEDETTNDDGEIIGNQHCDQEGCLMRAELQFSSGMSKMLTAKNGQVPDLDAECLLDVAANGGR
ncbi:hypothetical protein KO500_11270 [Cellulophaga baltica]|uniref:hypothetical protein n=1 Tax=Cellulophaga TaxID=104264 RepID=UPI001C066F61|nr:MULTISPECIES: hypothetical protein [Cellulophaga]MBU2997018.1 hypothetical protein [Cellulophaga baltica]MDO6768416.1 hypothetical protein [Cellulophaga sp. 1_MG-2023]